MIVVGAALQWGVQPALARAVLLAQRGEEAEQATAIALRRRLRGLTALNLGLGMLVLLFTAFITAL
jgi:hypothetical protein